MRPGTSIASGMTCSLKTALCSMLVYLLRGAHPKAITLLETIFIKEGLFRCVFIKDFVSNSITWSN